LQGKQEFRDYCSEKKFSQLRQLRGQLMPKPDIFGLLVMSLVDFLFPQLFPLTPLVLPLNPSHLFVTNRFSLNPHQDSF
jgi:hypothetical protein